MLAHLESLLDIEKYSFTLKNRSGGKTSVLSCTICGTPNADSGASYCPVCSGNRFTERMVDDVIYKSIRLSANGKAYVCPHCDNEELGGGDFCIICGNDVVNRCGDMVSGDNNSIVSRGCRSTLSGNARYCPRCGNESTFYQKGWLRDWRSENIKKAIANINVRKNDDIAGTTVEFDDIKAARDSV